MSASTTMVRILGTVDVVTARGDVIEVPSASQRRLLAALAIHAPQPVRVERLSELLGVVPGAVRTSIGRLRRLIGEDVVRNSAAGYRLQAPVDASVACAELDASGGDLDVVSAAIARWRGRALEEFEAEAWAAGDAARLAERRSAAVEDLAEGLIAAQRADQAIAMLERHVVGAPYRDRPRGLLMQALAACGRQTEALRVFQEYRDFLRETAGTEPSETVRRIDREIASGRMGAPSRGARTSHADSTMPVMPAVPIGEPAAVVVGRGEARAQLRAAADRVEEGRLQVVLLAGEAGLGKTTLMSDLVHAHCAPRGWTVLYGRCDEHIGSAFQAFQGPLASLVERLSEDGLRAHVRVCGAELLRLVPLMRVRLADVEPPEVSDEVTARHLLLLAVADLFRRAASSGPVVLIIDDAHWSDPTGLLLLRHLARTLLGVPVLIVAGYRDTGHELNDALRAAITDALRAGASRVELGGFDAAELELFVRDRVPVSQGRSVAPLVDALAAETAGNPLFVEHLVTHWIETGAVRVGDAALALESTGPTGVSSTLRDLVWDRVLSLGADSKRVFAAAAVLGVQFDERILELTADVEGDVLDDVLDAGVAAGLLARDGGSTLRFAHALVARSILAEQGPRAVVRLHARAFDAYEAKPAWAGPDRITRLARHAEEAHRFDEALRWAEAAAEEALAQVAPAEAAVWFRTALRLAEQLDRPGSVRADLMVRLGEAAFRAGDPTALDTIEAASELGRACDDVATIIRAAVVVGPGTVRLGAFAPRQLAIVEAAAARIDDADVNDDTRARVLASLAQSLLHTDQHERRVAAANESLALARASADPTRLARVAPDLLYALWLPGGTQQRLALATEALAVAQQMGDRTLLLNLHYLAHTAAVCAADAEAASLHLDAVRRIASEVNEPFFRWVAKLLDSFVACMEGRFADAEQLATEAFDIASQSAQPEGWSAFAAQIFVAMTFRGRHRELLPVFEEMFRSPTPVPMAFQLAFAIVLCECGEPERGRAMLREQMAAGSASLSQDFLGTTTVIGLAVLAFELGDVEAATWLHPLILPFADEVATNGMSSQGPIAAYLGKLSSLLGRFDEAEEHLLRALTIAESFGWEYHRATTLYALADNRVRASGRLDDVAHEWLSAASGLCERLGIANWGARADALLASTPR